MTSNENQESAVPKSHPRYESLKYRHKIIEGMKNLVVAEAGLIAHGRGECFDYILGEKTTETAKKAIKAALASLILAEKPVISVNGNVAALIPNELVILSNILNAPLEINLFYQKEGRIEAIKNVLQEAGAREIYGIDPKKMTELDGLESNRRKVELIANADADISIDSETIEGDVEVTSLPSSNVKINDKGVYRGSVIVAVTNADNKSGCSAGVGGGAIISSSLKCKADGQAVTREGDSIVVPVTGTTGSSACSFDVTVKVKDAGQDKVKAE